MEIVVAALLSFLADLMLGDPEWMPHPVVLFGKMIQKSEKELRELFPKDRSSVRRAGLMMTIFLPIVVLIVTWVIIYVARDLWFPLGFFLEVLWGWQALAMRDLEKESRNVHRRLTKGTLWEARQAVGRIVGRDTERLDARGVIRATIETVAENFSDGVVAPMFYLLIGGAPLAMCYKAINTMDSMVGYKNEQYIDYGRASAKLDDAANFVPSRIAALLLIGACAICGHDTENAKRIWKRDRRKHASPNSAQTESVMAGALGIELAGPAWYFGEYYDKPTIGTATREVETKDILRANRMMYTGSFLSLLIFCLIRTIISLLF